MESLVDPRLHTESMGKFGLKEEKKEEVSLRIITLLRQIHLEAYL
jgi:hypothetical protein